MYIERLRLRNVRLLAEQELSFVRPDGSIRLWTVLVGENGVCKSTLLQTIALSAMGPKLGSALVEDAQRLRNVRSPDAASIDATLRSPNGRPVRSSLRIESDRYDLLPGAEPEGALLLDRVRGRRERSYFIAGYGVGRFLAEPGEAVLPKDPLVHRVQGLFKNRHRMLGLEFYSALKNPDLALHFLRCLNQILESRGAGGERLLPGWIGLQLGAAPVPPMFDSRRVAVEVGGRPMEIPATWLSDGYQATLSWIADLVGHAVLELERGMDPRTFEGIVLLDEVDLHLHPTWQRRIVPVLREIFPKLQFIVTTHSPLVLTGFEGDEIIPLKLVDGEVVQDPAGIEPGVLTASEILTGYFDVQHAGRPDLVAKERRYLELRGMTVRSAAEETELHSACPR